jgi:hypothetical protein
MGEVSLGSTGPKISLRKWFINAGGESHSGEAVPRIGKGVSDRGQDAHRQVIVAKVGHLTTQFQNCLVLVLTRHHSIVIFLYGAKGLVSSSKKTLMSLYGDS